MTTVFEVADWFLHKKAMTHKQLQKMCYYAQAWHYALLNKPLFEEEIQAWIHGPVIPELYARYVGRGWIPIEKLKGRAPKFSRETVQVLRAVYSTYSRLDGDQLESLTHSELPWKEARGDIAPHEPCTNPISLQTMQAYYGEKYRQDQGD